MAPQSSASFLKKSLCLVLGASYHHVGHDEGAWVAYAWTAQFPNCVKSLTLLDAAIPGLSAQQTHPVPYEANLKMWQFSFNVLPEPGGRKRELFNWAI
jgi:pimeloyl-ACP methyl ester carboxylesterase